MKWQCSTGQGRIGQVKTRQVVKIVEHNLFGFSGINCGAPNIRGGSVSVLTDTDFGGIANIQ